MRHKTVIIGLATFFPVLFLILSTAFLYQRNRQTIGSRAQTNTGSPSGSCSVLQFTPRDNCTPSSAVDAQMWKYADYTCDNGTAGSVGDGSCKSGLELKQLANQACQQSCGGNPPPPGGGGGNVSPPVGGTPPAGGGGNVPPPGGTNPTPVCEEGIKEIRAIACKNPPPVVAPTTAVSRGIAGVEIICHDGSTVTLPDNPNPDQCISPEEIKRLMEERKPCEGKRSPSCGRDIPIPTSPDGGKEMCANTIVPGFECWRKGWAGEEACGRGDFNGNGKCDELADFELWRRRVQF